MGDIIYFNSPIIEEQGFKEGLEAIKALPKEESMKITNALYKLMLLEVTIGLGLRHAEDVNKEFGTDFDDDDDKDFTFFYRIQQLYDTSNRGCYFCDQSIDPNDDFFNDKTQICPNCQLKLANILTFEGLDPVRRNYLPLIFKKRVQKRRDDDGN